MDGQRLFGDWCPTAPRAAWLAFVLMDSTSWQHLPNGGGLMDQDESLMEDIALLVEMHSLVKLQMDLDEQLGELADNA